MAGWCEIEKGEVIGGPKGGREEGGWGSVRKMRRMDSSMLMREEKEKGITRKYERRGGDCDREGEKIRTSWCNEKI